MTEHPLISIITPSLNRAEFIEEAVQCVLAQDYPDVEHIIMDGGSTDGTLDLLSQYPHLKIVSEKDAGIYDALNKGLALANGEIIGFLNTDDYYTDNIFQNLVAIFKANPQCQAVVGGADIFMDGVHDGKKVMFTYPPVQEDSYLYRTTRGVPIFNAWFFRKILFERIGPFDLKYTLASDRDFLIRLYRSSINFLPCPTVIYHFRAHVGSLTITAADMGESLMTTENRSLCEEYLRDFRDDKQARNMLHLWHSDLTSDQVISAVKARGFARAISYAKAGLKYNSLWPVQFLVRLSHRAVGSVSRRILSSSI